MQSIKLKNGLNDYTPSIAAGYLLVGVLRLLEVGLLLLHYGLNKKILVSEAIGLGYDLLLVSSLFVLFAPVYLLVYSLNKKVSQIILWFFALTLSFIHFVILKYFLYQLIPLDVFLYQYSFQEVLFTVKTSDTSIGSSFVLVLFVFFSASACLLIFAKKQISKKIKKRILQISVLSLPIFILLNTYLGEQFDKYTQNKTAYFASRSIAYWFSSQNSITADLEQDCKDFQSLFPSKQFVDSKYPLLFKADRENVLGEYFEKFEGSPNIVLIIVEGLNDDFIHNYKGAMLMPFLNELKDRSLYWNKCFTLGEKSFAAVPSILGGLPYGQKGFTVMDKLPRHLSLVSILNSNHYHNTFYYGQASWFHRKDRFFKFNNADLIVDKYRFPSKYEKILAGSDHFFWGYNDKDLYNRSFEVNDSLKVSKKMDVYFTGSTHSPFVINEKASYYDLRYKKLINKENQAFFHTYERNLKTVLFADDALREFFEKYKTKAAYKNTIFIITGDHPMTEVPTANSLKRYHVPMIIYSDKLKHPKTFSNIVSHLDVSETILNVLKDYLSVIPNLSTSLGSSLIAPRNDVGKLFAFMNENREVIDYYSNGYYLAKETLYKVDSTLEIKAVDDQLIKGKMRKELNTIKKIGLYASMNNRIISNKEYGKALNRKIYYSVSNPSSTMITSEYYDIVPSIKIPHEDLIFDLSFNINASHKQISSLVYQITDSRNKTLLWKEIGSEKGSILLPKIKP